MFNDRVRLPYTRVILSVVLFFPAGCGDPPQTSPKSAAPTETKGDSPDVGSLDVDAPVAAANPGDSERDTATEDESRPKENRSASAANGGETSVQTNQHGTRQGEEPNRLASETSPYLLMHARNPVDWYPWGEEAFAKAKREGKLIFLSIGYSSCYWCHVMERESFLDEKIAAQLNADFVSIKIDREERPDIDEIYMTSLQAMSGQGGWPLSMFLTPDAKPIVGGTYFPPESRGGRLGFPDVLRNVQTAWQRDRAAMEKQAGLLAEHVRKALRQAPPSGEPLRVELVEETERALAESFDPKYGGFGFSPTNPTRPKFPEPANLVFLLHRAEQRDAAPEAREMLIQTLEKMAQGGIYDHLGGGFHRYSTDRFWRVPHFEKMLYDNAQLVGLFAIVGEIENRDDFRRTARGTAEFVLREMTSEEGAFYSALDAETDAVEGKFYFWSHEQLSETLTQAEWDLLAPIFGFAGEPNFEEHYVLQLSQPLAESAKERNLSEAALLAKLEPAITKLFEQRAKRTRPLADTKILTAWNGLMIEGLADAGRALDEPRYVAVASRAARFLLTSLRDADGRLLRTYSGGEARLNAYLDDYAFLVAGLIALDRATDDPRWRAAALEIMEKQIELFADQEFGGFFYTTIDHEALIARSKDPADGVIPAGNSVSARNLIYLGKRLERQDLLEQAERCIRAQRDHIERSPAMMPLMSVALAELLQSDPVAQRANP